MLVAPPFFNPPPRSTRLERQAEDAAADAEQEGQVQEELEGGEEEEPRGRRQHHAELALCAGHLCLVRRGWMGGCRARERDRWMPGGGLLERWFERQGKESGSSVNGRTEKKRFMSTTAMWPAGSVMRERGRGNSVAAVTWRERICVCGWVGVDGWVGG